MWEIFFKQLSARIASIFFILYSFWWVFFTFLGIVPAFHYDLFTVSYGFVAIWGSIFGFIIAKHWGGLRSIMGKAIFFFALGLALQEVGQLGYTYYIYYLGIDVPYPSWGDIAFYGSIPCYLIGVSYLARAAGVRLSLHTFASKLQAIFIPASLLILSYFLFLQDYQFDWSNPLVIMLDLGVPVGQAIYIGIAILTYTLTRGFLGGIMKTKVLLVLFALFAQYIADWTFLYQANRGTWTVSGVNDYMFFFAYFIMTIALINLSAKSLKKHLE